MSLTTTYEALEAAHDATLYMCERNAACAYRIGYDDLRKAAESPAGLGEDWILVRADSVEDASAIGAEFFNAPAPPAILELDGVPCVVLRATRESESWLAYSTYPDGTRAYASLLMDGGMHIKIAGDERRWTIHVDTYDLENNFVTVCSGTFPEAKAYAREMLRRMFDDVLQEFDNL